MVVCYSSPSKLMHIQRLSETNRGGGAWKAVEGMQELIPTAAEGYGDDWGQQVESSKALSGKS